ncbi:acyltransferase family protein [Curtobacterium sp. AB451]|uniref:acyltransferase family protein n=1 Tax=Curtobacterium sp. AB451 TaxID=3422306 RepID=UPI003D3504F9
MRIEIQALRAAAVLSVVLYHLWPNRLPGGFVGVDVFFAISGFLITGHLLGEIDRTGRVAVGTFWARRVRRLLPASLLVLLVTALGVLLVVPRTYWAQFSQAILGSTLYAENWLLASQAVDYLAADNTASPVQHFWSLGVEEQFYLVWPIILLLTILVVRRRARIGVIAVLAVLFALSLVLSVYTTATNPSLAYFGTHIRVWEFAAGGLVAALQPEALRVDARVRSLVSWAGWAAIAVTLLIFTGDTPFPSATALLPVLATLAVIVAGAPETGDPRVDRWSPTGLMEFGPVQLIGDLSYSLYLWHWPLIVIVPFALGHPLGFVDKLVILAAGILLAALTKRLVEDTTRNAMPRAKRRNLMTFGAAAAAMVLVAAVPIGTVQYTQTVQARSAAAASKLASSGSGCFGALAMTAGDKCREQTAASSLLPDRATLFDDTGGAFSCYRPAGQATLKRCSFGSEKADAEKVALVGDSHAAMLIPGLRDRAVAADWHVDTFVGNGGVWRTPDSVAAGPDRQYLQALQDALIDGKYDMILTTAHRDLLTTPSRQRTIVPAITGAWTLAEDAGSTVVPILDNPEITPAALSCVTDAPASQQSFESCSVPEREGLGGADYNALAAKSAGLKPIDMHRYFCSAGACPVVVGGAIVYRDAHHMTATYSKTVAPFLVDAVQEDVG